MQNNSKDNMSKKCKTHKQTDINMQIEYNKAQIASKHTTLLQREINNRLKITTNRHEGPQRGKNDYK